MTYRDEELTAAIVAALDSVYARPDVREAIPSARSVGPVGPVGLAGRIGPVGPGGGMGERGRRPRGPRLASRHGIWLAAAAVVVLILAYPAVTAINGGQARPAAGASAVPVVPSASSDAVRPEL